jgi:hypothetical protein
MERGEREREEGGKRDRWGGWNGKWEKGRGRGAARKVGGCKCRVRLGYLLFRFSFLLYFFLDSIKPVRFDPVQSV